ncbi:HlyC/CorC family transporter [bacterium]|nr:HlyC/CorC family transporter [bacterium]
MIILNLFIILLLLLANAFFVASEFALVSVRQTRIQQLANEGNKTADVTLKALSSLDRYIAATQLGITIASLGLGWVGESTLATIIHPLFEFLPNISGSVATHSIAAIIAFTLITFMHVVIGELMPKSIALQFPEKTTLVITRPLVTVANILAPFIFLLNGFGNWMLKLINIEPAQQHHSVHSEEELDMIIDESFKGGVLNETESFLLKNSLKFTDLTAKQVMIPRCNMIAIPIDINEEDYAKLVLENQYTRYPVYSENLDNIVGILHVKDLYSCLLQNQKISIKEVLRQPLLVPETMTTDNLLEEFKKNKTEIAIVIDEFGGVSGIVTMEDILEEVFGSVQDEFDEEETDIKKIDENKFIVNGLFRFEEFSEYFGLNQEEDEDVETIGGLVQKLLCRLAKINDEVEIENLKLRVIELKDRRIKKVLVEKIIKEEKNIEE